MERPRFLFDFPPLGEAHGPLAFGMPRRVLEAQRHDDVRATIAAAEACARAGAWVAGFVPYEAAPAFDPAHVVAGDGRLPFAWFAVFDRPLSWASVEAGAFIAPHAWSPSVPRGAYDANVAAILDGIARGDSYQVNYTLRLRAPFLGDALGWYLRLRERGAGGYGAYLDLGHRQIVSASPELFFRRDGERLTARPMKGTAPAGATDEENAARAAALRESAKNRAENLMIVDLLRNDLSRVAVPHSVAVPELFHVETYPTLLQMTSTVTAVARPGVGLADVFAALFPCGSVTGAPKIKAMETIARLEDAAREIYCGAIGLIAPGGDAIFNVAIRTVLVDAARGEATCGVGGGIVADSAASAEYEELLLKARFLEEAEPGFALFETMRLEGGSYPLLERHLARIARSARILGFRFDGDAARARLARHAGEAENGRGRVKLVLHRDGALELEAGALPALAAGALEFALSDVAVDSRDPFLAHKTTRRALYDRAKAAHPGVFDVLLWNERGELTEFTRGNVVLERGGKLYTPPLASGLLPGTLRAELVERGEVAERILTLDDLAWAERTWFVNGLRGRIELHRSPQAGRAPPQRENVISITARAA